MNSRPGSGLRMEPRVGIEVVASRWASRAAAVGEAGIEEGGEKRSALALTLSSAFSFWIESDDVSAKGWQPFGCPAGSPLVLFSAAVEGFDSSLFAGSRKVSSALA